MQSAPQAARIAHLRGAPDFLDQAVLRTWRRWQRVAAQRALGRATPRGRHSAIPWVSALIRVEVQSRSGCHRTNANPIRSAEVRSLYERRLSPYPSKYWINKYVPKPIDLIRRGIDRSSC